MSKATVLIVDDEPDLLELVSLTLSRMNLDTHTAPDVATAQRLLKSQPFDLCLTDMRLPDGDGLDLVAWIQEYRPQVLCAVITAHGNVESAVRALHKAVSLGADRSVQLTDDALAGSDVAATGYALSKALEKLGVKAIDPAGEPFDPARHEAMMAQESDTAEPNSVLQVVQPGYELNGRLLRPARVIVSRSGA